MTRQRSRPRYMTHFMTFVSIAILAWNIPRQLLTGLPELVFNNVEFIQSHPIDQGFTTTKEQRLLDVIKDVVHGKELDSTADPVSLSHTVDAFDTSSDWPPMEILQFVLAESHTLVSQHANQSIIPRLLVAASSAEDVDFADNFAVSLIALNVTNFVLVPLDRQAYQVLQELHPNHTLPVLPGLESYNENEIVSDSIEHDIILAYRPIVIRSFLGKGYAVFYNDVDMVWRQNAWNKVDERYKSITANTAEIMLWKDGSLQICDCMMYLQPTMQSLAFMEQWEQEILVKRWDNDQAALTRLGQRLNLPFQGGGKEGIWIFPNDLQFPTGQDYSWDLSVPENKMAVIVHNNWIVDKTAQRNRFEAAGLWKPSGHDGSQSDFSNWPPTEFLNSLLESATIPSSTRTKEGVPRVVVIASNFEYVDFADNFANSLLALNITNFVIVPLDKKSFEILHMAYPEHTLPTLPGLQSIPEGKAEFGSKEFKLLTASRPIFLRPFLQKGYAILYNDIDMVWKRNAWDVIDRRDVNTQNESVPLETMLWKDDKYQICTCMLYLKPSNDTLSLIDKWEDEINTDAYFHDQAAFDKVAKRQQFPFWGGIRQKTKVSLNDLQFPSGKEFSWNQSSPDSKKAVIVHNNWIRGKDNKRDRFERSGLWKPSGRLSAIS